jgi:hypothetical protein
LWDDVTQVHDSDIRSRLFCLVGWISVHASHSKRNVRGDEHQSSTRVARASVSGSSIMISLQLGVNSPTAASAGVGRSRSSGSLGGSRSGSNLHDFTGAPLSKTQDDDTLRKVTLLGLLVGGGALLLLIFFAVVSARIINLDRALGGTVRRGPRISAQT